MMETSRHTKKTLYVLAAFYVVVGFVAATASALNGDRLGTFLGFLIISGALAATALLRAVLRIGVRLSAIGDAVAEMQARLGRLETGLNDVRERAGAEKRPSEIADGVRMLDLAAMGNGNRDALAAATLDHEAFPRLVATMEEEPPAQCDEVAARDEEQKVVARDEKQSATSDPMEATTQDLLRQWRVALSDGDLAGCRGLYSALMDAAGVEAVASLGEPMEALADRVERSLRESFSSHVRTGDYAGGLAIGERMCSLLPGRPVTEEFQRIRPYLLGRLDREASTSNRPLAASQ